MNESLWVPENLIEEIKVYTKILTKAISENSSQLIPNSGEYHAAAMMSKMIESTQHSLNMVVGSFAGHVSGLPPYQIALSQFLEKPNIEVKILFLESPNEESKAIAKFREQRDFHRKDIIFKKANEETFVTLANSFALGALPHFSIFDDDKFRLEINPKSYSAFGSFNDCSRVGKLQNIFASAFASADDQN